ncbi:hypothetical protein NC652_017974 [Populus alba x Populus x berolinensis]|nr:hypothetical protein NC652_017974 [Populus alba x Populus x berolinensis]
MRMCDEDRDENEHEMRIQLPKESPGVVCVSGSCIAPRVWQLLNQLGMSGQEPVPKKEFSI